jgi:molecular chaperone DnaK (HSP70)
MTREAEREAKRTNRYVVGIDLGTTHCAIAYSRIGHDDVELLPIPQLVAAGESAARTLLPSFLYLPAEGEGDAPFAGEHARDRGGKSPNRLIASAKSWICHGGVNRRAPILPWSAPDGEPKLSPLDAQVHLLRHLREAWDDAHPKAPLAEQDVVVTVPASFDEVARELTVAAAKEAGVPEVRLIEEPQAAFYDYLGHAGVASLKDARLILVVDVGGGTTDLTLLKVDGEDVSRIAVGGHLMLGGENMDAALAHHALEIAGMSPEKLDATEWSALTHAARDAKERLLGEDAPEQHSLTLQRRGRRLIGGTKTIQLEREKVRALLVDGFVPFTAPDEVAAREGRAGLTTLGLPYTNDPALPRHIATFLRKHVLAAEDAGADIVEGLPRPDFILLNGGVFHAAALRERLDEVTARWFGEVVPSLPPTSLDTAVARGAARFALAKHGLGQLIEGGAARAYYVGVEDEGGRARAICVTPKGMEEDTSVHVRDRTFHLLVNQKVAFPLYAYPGDRVDAVGTVIDVDDDLEVLPALETTVRRDPDLWVDPKTGGVPVHLEAHLEIGGTLALSLASLSLPPRRWRLKLDLGSAPAPQPKPAARPDEPEALEPLPEGFKEVHRTLDTAWGTAKNAAQPDKAKAARGRLESALGSRGLWSTQICRALFDELIVLEERRGRSPEHELAWLRLLSWSARPGFGAPGDEARIEKLWDLHDLGLKHTGDKLVWAEWWILWRRVAAGLSPVRQRALLGDIEPWLENKPPKGVPRAHGIPEMLRMVAALERLPAADKEKAAAWLKLKFKKVRSWWPLGRLGARVPFHGEARDVVPAATAETWLEELLALDWKTAEGASFAAVLIARKTGDDRDVSEALRKRALSRLRESEAPTPWLDMVRTVTELSGADAKRTFGEGLPAGLRLT